MRINKVIIVGTDLDFYELLLYEERFLTIFEDMRNMVYGRLEHFKGGNTL